jgi:hypothetical protein
MNNPTSPTESIIAAHCPGYAPSTRDPGRVRMCAGTPAFDEPPPITERLDMINTLPPLTEGNHASIEEGACVMELVSWVAGEPWSDHPECVCPVIAAFLRAWNDGLPDGERDTLLRPLIPLVMNTRATTAIERRRALMAADWLVREHTPAWLRLAKLDAHADALAALPEITDMAQCPSLMPILEAARTDAAAAWAAAWAAAGDAARDAAWAAAWAAARDAAWAAAWAAARDAAWAAARAAARDAAWAAARAAAWAAAGDAARTAAGDAARTAAGDAAWAAARAAAWAAAGDAARTAARTAAGDAARTAAGDAARTAAGDAAWAAARAAAWDAAGDALESTRLALRQSALRLVHRMLEVGK